MGRPRGGRAQQTGRPVMRSPGRPPVGRREHRQRFWAAIARGERSDVAGVEAGVSPVGRRPVVSGGWRDAADQSGSAVRAVPVVRRARGDRDAARRWRQGAARSRARWAARRRRSRGSCGATPRRAAAAWITGRRARSGMPISALSAPSRPSWRSTIGCVAMCRTGWLAACSALTASPWLGRRSRGSAASRSPPGPALGAVVEPGADLQPVAPGLPR